MQISNKKYIGIVIFLIFVEITMVFLCVKSYSNKNIEEQKEETKVDKEIFSIYINDGDGEYIKDPDGNQFANYLYELNLELSKCKKI